jgi:hypothetical protein
MATRKPPVQWANANLNVEQMDKGITRFAQAGVAVLKVKEVVLYALDYPSPATQVTFEDKISGGLMEVPLSMSPIGIMRMIRLALRISSVNSSALQNSLTQVHPCSCER